MTGLQEDKQNNYSCSSNTRIGKNEANWKVKDKGEKRVVLYRACSQVVWKCLPQETVENKYL